MKTMLRISATAPTHRKLGDTVRISQPKAYRQIITWTRPTLMLVLCFFGINLSQGVASQRAGNLFAGTYDVVVEERTITGVVKDGSDGSPLAGVNVWIKGTNHGTITDADGRFSLTYDFKEGDLVVFSFVGFESYEYEVAASGIMDLEIKLDYQVLMGAVATDEVYEPKARLWNRIKRAF